MDGAVGGAGGEVGEQFGDGAAVPGDGACRGEGGDVGDGGRGGVAIARSIDDARRRLADMLIFCGPTAAAVADITAFTPTRTVARDSGTVAE